MKKKIFLAALAMCLLPLTASADEVLTSPDGAYQLTESPAIGRRGTTFRPHNSTLLTPH